MNPPPRKERAARVIGKIVRPLNDAAACGTRDCDDFTDWRYYTDG
jgi:hypothetical protein